MTKPRSGRPRNELDSDPERILPHVVWMPGTTLAEFKALVIKAAVEHYGNYTRAANSLGLSKNCLKAWYERGNPYKETLDG